MLELRVVMGSGLCRQSRKEETSNLGTLGKFLKLSVLLCLYCEINSVVLDKC